MKTLRALLGSLPLVLAAAAFMQVPPQLHGQQFGNSDRGRPQTLPPILSDGRGGDGRLGPSRSVALAYESAFVSLRDRTEKLAKAVGPGEPEISRLLSEIRTNVVFLHERWQQWSEDNPLAWSANPAGDDYLLSLNRDYDLLRKAEKELTKLLKLKKAAAVSRRRDRVLYAYARAGAAAPAVPLRLAANRKEAENAQQAREKVVALLGIVATDLEVKAEHCRHSPTGLGRTIKVVVRTKRAGEEAPGYEVWFVQKGLYGSKSAYDRFRKQSSPTDERGLAPGGYAVWAQKGKTVFDPTSLRIGGRGEEAVEVDLEVP